VELVPIGRGRHTASSVTLTSLRVSSPIRIVVAEPDYLAREGLVRALEAVEGLSVVSMCSTISSLRAAAQLESPDVVVMPLTFSPGRATQPIQLVDELQEASPTTGVVLLGDQSELALAVPLFDSGIARRAFILRSRIRNAAQLTRAIREVAGGNSLVDPAAVGTLLTAARRSTELPFSTLTDREREVLRMIADAESNSAIARELLITTRAVERHVNSIFRKLGLSGSRDVNRRVQAALAFKNSMHADELEPARGRRKAVHPVRARH
jgi:DNA-binding NarL/FixJ family response regulator